MTPVLLFFVRSRRPRQHQAHEPQRPERQLRQHSTDFLHQHCAFLHHFPQISAVLFGRSYDFPRHLFHFIVQSAMMQTVHMNFRKGGSQSE